MSSPEKKVTATRFGGRREWRLTGGFHGEMVGGEWRAVHGGALGEVWWAMAQQGTAATFLARGAWQSGSGRVHSARGDAVDFMHVLGPDKWGQERRTDGI